MYKCLGNPTPAPSPYATKQKSLFFNIGVYT